MNPGGLRADLAYPGEVDLTYAEAAAVQPFANTLVTCSSPVLRSRRVLEQQWQPAARDRVRS